MNALLVIAGGLQLALNLEMPRTRTPYSFPVANYEAAVERVQARQAEDDSIVVTGARSIFMTHGRKTPRVFVLLHGFTDSPKQFEQLGLRLFAGGDNVYIPRLPHHSERERRLRALGRVTAGELVAFGDSTVDIAVELGDSVIVVGLSAGGNITSSIAQNRPDVKRAVVIAPAIAAGRVSNEISRSIVGAALRLPDLVRNAPRDTMRPDYIQGISTRGLSQVLRLGQEIRKNAEQLPVQTKQIAFLLNENDHTVSDDAAIDVARLWESGQALVSVYRFPASLRLPHNTMESTEYGGNLEIVLPVVEALAKGMGVPASANYLFLFSEGNKPKVVSP